MVYLFALITWLSGDREQNVTYYVRLLRLYINLYSPKNSLVTTDRDKQTQKHTE